jgi:hypothetical protein
MTERARGGSVSYLHRGACERRGRRRKHLEVLVYHGDLEFFDSDGLLLHDNGWSASS